MLLRACVSLFEEVGVEKSVTLLELHEEVNMECDVHKMPRMDFKAF